MSCTLSLDNEDGDVPYDDDQNEVLGIAELEQVEDEEALDKVRQELEEDWVALDREKQVLGEGVLEVGIMMMVGVKNHVDGDQEGCDDQVLDGQNHG